MQNLYSNVQLLLSFLLPTLPILFFIWFNIYFIFIYGTRLVINVCPYKMLAFLLGNEDGKLHHLSLSDNILLVYVNNIKSAEYYREKVKILTDGDSLQSAVNEISRETSTLIKEVFIINNSTGRRIYQIKMEGN